jgi:hypothetical protein
MSANLFYRGIVILVGSLTLTTIAQTNCLPPFSQLFILPEPLLRAEWSERTMPAVESRPGQLEEQRSDSFAVSAPRNDRAFPYEQRVYIVGPFQKSEDVFSRSIDSIFRPEEFRVGKTTVSCSILTAIKRKNPLCLLNPLFVNVSW